MNHAIRSTLVVGAAIGVALSSVPAEPSASHVKSMVGSEQACSLVTTPEIERIIGKPLEGKPYAYDFPGGDGSTCTYQGGQIQIVVFSGAGSGQKYDSYLANSLKKAARTGAPDLKKYRVSGIGRSAYYTFPKPQVGILVVDVGRHTVGVSMVTSFGVSGETLKPKLLSLAKAAIAKLS